MKNFKLTLCLGVASLAFSATVLARTVDVYSGVELQNALKSALPGDDIVLHPADYGDASFETSGNLAAYFFASRSGTEEDPITVRSHSHSDLQELYGSGPNGFNNNYVLYVTGDHWVFRDLKIHTAKKGVMMDGADDNVFDNVEVYNTGDEAFHMRQSSSRNKLTNCWIHDSGKIPGRAGYGEGVYIGSHNGDIIGDYANGNLVGGCVIGPGVTAELIEVKEATVDTVLENNWLLGRDVSGENFADSFVDVKGNRVTIRSNMFGDEGSPVLSRGIHFLNDKTHEESWVYRNRANMSPSEPFLFVGGGVVHERFNRKISHDQGVLEVVYRDDASVDNDINPSVHKPSKGYRGYSDLPNGKIFPSFMKKEKKPKKDKSDYDNCQAYTYLDRTELDLSVSPCVDLSVDLAGKTLQVWDSDENPSCDFRGVVQSLDGEGELTVAGNYITSTEMTGQKILFSADNGCGFVKMRIY